MSNEFQIRSNLIYIHKADHRNNSPRKSQWTISVRDEKTCFFRMYNLRWCEGNYGWSLHLNKGITNYLGVSVKRHRKLFLAKFVGGNNNQLWHGYPADHILNQQDTPTMEILLAWKLAGYISLPKVRKLIKGQPCNL